MLDPTHFPVPTYGSANALLVEGDCCDLLRRIPAGSVHCVVTSPPYWGLRDYGLPPSVWGRDPKCSHEWVPMGRGRRADLRPRNQTSSTGRLGRDEREGQAGRDGGKFCVRCDAWRGCLGLEPRIDMFIDHLVALFREVRRVLRDDGTVWLNLGDCYASAPNGRSAAATKAARTDDRTFRDKPFSTLGELPAKNLAGIPWRVALALQADGWILRSDIVWAKPNCLPESVRDRPTKSHEYLFLLAKSPRYYYDADAIREPHTTESLTRARRNRSGERTRAYPGAPPTVRMGAKQQAYHPPGRNKRTVWTIPTAPFKGAHFATFPPALVQPCILAGTSAAGCCPRCGAPWERIVERGEPLRNWQRACGGDAKGRYRGSAMKEYATAGAQDASAVKARILAGLRARKTMGWRPNCHCDAGPPVPSVVLDPFAGAATAGLVARQLERDFIGIELSAKYVKLARQRLALR